MNTIDELDETPEFKCQNCGKEISADELGQDTYDEKTLKSTRLCLDCVPEATQ